MSYQYLRTEWQMQIVLRQSEYGFGHASSDRRDCDGHAGASIAAALVAAILDGPVSNVGSRRRSHGNLLITDRSTARHLAIWVYGVGRAVVDGRLRHTLDPSAKASNNDWPMIGQDARYVRSGTAARTDPSFLPDYGL